jgi:amino acid transporter
LFYGLGIIVGAGIYVAIGSVIERAGDAAPVSFLLAGIAAGLTGLCYAELASRFPEAAGAASFTKHGFKSDRLAQVVGAAVTVTVAVAAASIAAGAIHYVEVVIPLPAAFLKAIMIFAFTAIAAYGVQASVGIAAALSVVEVAGLVVVTFVGFSSAPDFDMIGMVPSNLDAWHGVFAGAFIAFFAFIGFETLANLGEEVKDPHRTLPRGIIGAVAISVVLYVLVTAATVLGRSEGANPLLALFDGRNATIFAAVISLAVANGVLVEIVMLARLFYGMASNGQLPPALAKVHPQRRTPMLATMVAGGIVLTVVLLVPFGHLLVLANALTLAVFAVVDIALWRVKREAPATARTFSVPRWLPIVAAAFSVALMLAAIANLFVG